MPPACSHSSHLPPSPLLQVLGELTLGEQQLAMSPSSSSRRHPGLMQMLGVHPGDKGTLLIFTDFCGDQQLLSFLRSQHPTGNTWARQQDSLTLFLQLLEGTRHLHEVLH